MTMPTECIGAWAQKDPHVNGAKRERCQSIALATNAKPRGSFQDPLNSIYYPIRFGPWRGTKATILANLTDYGDLVIYISTGFYIFFTSSDTESRLASLCDQLAMTTMRR